MSQDPNQPADWWMYHGDPAHTGYVGGGSRITSQNVGASLKLLHAIQLRGPVMSVPALVGGYAYVGTANSKDAPGANGGSFFKINLETGVIEQTYSWAIDLLERDSHGFTGMACTPAVADGRVIFSALDGQVYCLDQATLKLLWKTNLRHADPAQNQPVENTVGQFPPGSGEVDQPAPPVAGWSSPVVAGGKVFVGVGEGENPSAYGFVYCLDAQTGKVRWLFCTCQFTAFRDNQPNVLPNDVVADPAKLPAGFTIHRRDLVFRGASVWAGIAYDADLKRLYCSTGNPSPDGVLPTPGYTNGLLVLDAETGNFVKFRQFPWDGSYRVSDADVDVGGSATLFIRQGRKVVGLGCKNGCYMILDAETLEPVVDWRQMLPFYNDGTQIPTVDPHGDAEQVPNPRLTNEQSNTANAATGADTENFYGTYSTAAIHPGLQRLFIGIGGNNYHLIAPGIDTETTPFMRAMDWNTLEDAWPMDDNNPKRYLNARPPMYTNATESGLSIPAVVNDVVFMATSHISLYAFNAADGSLLWQDRLGAETGGLNSGYGYCLGAAIWGDYVVAGALITGRDGGVLKIYKLSA
ncbi:MAG TPA: PQQ-binding-like beta-propeller repeat protein [Chthoniobacteraceae bacterium]|jgi:outer membrane protein assembly factor BamB|nr:PQQ-binding-like beta-propeller repeat protein [Chthoniobacteraceae bacterium]